MAVIKSNNTSILGVQDDEAPKDSMVKIGSSTDGRFEITLTARALEARVNFFPPDDPAKLINETFFTTCLNSLNIIYGLKWDAVEKAIQTCNLYRKPVPDVLVAQGKPPVDDEAEYFELNPKLVNAVPRRAQGLNKIDYKAYSPFIIVRRNQVLARRRSKVFGQEGRNVHDESIPYKILMRKGYLGGTNTRLEGEYIYATIHGQLVEDKLSLSVREALVIKGPVGYGTGNIVFPGDVFINGPVSDGFKIYSGGSITIKQTFDVTEAIAKKDLTVTGGIIGRGRALVKVGGTLKTKFIDNCRVACRGTININKELVRSSVYSMNTLNLGEKGVILGSNVYTLHGVTAKGIGKNFSIASSIHCGIDFTIMQDKEKNSSRLRLLSAKLRRYRQQLADLHDTMAGSADLRTKLEAAILQLEEEQKTISNRISDLLTKINCDQDAVIEVSGEVLAGTLIEICQVGQVLIDPLRKVRIVLNKNTRTLDFQKL
ncbi:hypothetical protein FACS1894130_01720 [Spirochaetia bacterium]|nr:hypothetical protein FACS1894130_01720 [Spirochaetia bacterium]